MQVGIHSRWLRYGTSIAAVGLALGLKYLLIPIVTQDSPFLLFFTAVLVAAWLGGLGPGIVATVLAALFNLYFFMQPFERFTIANPGQPPQLVLFVVEGVFISVICANWQAARRRAQASDKEARELERRILEISDAEQRRIGHDLHDGLGQHLTGIALMTRHLENKLAAEGSKCTQKVAELSALAKTAVEWTHDLSRSLSPPALETRGLAEALHELAANAENIFSIQCAFEQEDQADSRDVAAAVHLYRIAQEAISNAVKHGRAKHVQIRLSSRDKQIRMQIIDDGSGIEPAESATEQSDGMGLRIMRYRAQMIGARIEIQHSQRRSGQNGTGSGTIVTCTYEPTVGPQPTTQSAAAAQQDLENADQQRTQRARTVGQ